MSLTTVLPKRLLNVKNVLNLKLCSVKNFSSSNHCQKMFSVKNNEEFMDKVMSSVNPVVVNFHAEWCEPCKILTPKLKELVEPLENVDLAIIDVEIMPELVDTFEVKAVPAVLAVRNGAIVDKFIGLVDADMITNLIDKLDVNKKS